MRSTRGYSCAISSSLPRCSKVIQRPMASKATFAGPSGLCIEPTVALTLRSAGNGESTNGSSDTPVRPRKRQRRPETWKRAVAKSKRAKGEEYTSPSTGVTVLSRGTGPDCRCRRRCFDSVSQSERAAILAAFYGLGSKDLQDAHLFGMIQSIPVKRRRPRGDGRTSRRATYTYVVSVCVGWCALTRDHACCIEVGNRSDSVPTCGIQSIGRLETKLGRLFLL